MTELNWGRWFGRPVVSFNIEYCIIADFHQHLAFFWWCAAIVAFILGKKRFVSWSKNSLKKKVIVSFLFVCLLYLLNRKSMVDIWEDLRLLIQTSGELLLEFPSNLCSHGWGQFLTLFESREDQPEGEERLIKMKSLGPIIFLKQVAAGFEKWLCCPAKFWLFAWLDDKAIHDFKQCWRLQISLVEKYPEAIGGDIAISEVESLRFTFIPM